LEFVQPNEEWYLEVFARHTVELLALDLLKRLLRFDHNHRITAAEALDHEFFGLYRNDNYKKIAPIKFDFRFEKKLVVNSEEEKMLYGRRSVIILYSNITV
jgi:serine/threonine protein kinase